MAEVLQFPTAAESAPASAPDAADTLGLTDTEARRAALDIRRSWIVEAPAGSGKTGLLIQRFLKLLAFGDVQRPGEVLGITFTRKAAAELRTRVLEQLGSAATGKSLKVDAGEYEQTTRELASAVLARDRIQGWHLLDTPQSLNIRTIDSFCGTLAGSLPLLSQGAGSRQPVDDPDPLYEQAAERTLRELGGSDAMLDDALRCVLLHRDGQVGEAIRLVAGMLKDREQWGELVPLEAETLTEDVLDGPIKKRLEGTLERIVCDGLSEAERAIGPELLHDLARFASRLSREPGYKGAVSPIALCFGRSHAPGAEAANLDHWLALLKLLLKQDGGWRSSLAVNAVGFPLPKPDARWLKNLLVQLKFEDELRPGLREALCAVRDLPPARYPDDQWRVAKALFRLLRRALAELGVIFAERGACDFTEIALTARRLLRSDRDLLNSPGAQLTHLLVDEVQDTSSGQYELLELLTRSWDGATQTMFLVGDPKQSIYLFRQARVARFLRTQAMGRLGEVPLGALRLTANFRSQAQLVQQFNETFGLILPRPEKMAQRTRAGVEVSFVASIPKRPCGASPALRWHARIAGEETSSLSSEPASRYPEDRPDPNAPDEACDIRHAIEEFTASWKARPVRGDAQYRPPKIAVLARSRAHLAPIIAEFRRDHGRGALPFRAIDIELLNERPEVLDVLALTRALLHPGDRVAWLAVLHSPVCGLGLADLLALTGEGPEGEAEATVAYLVQTRAHLLSVTGQQRLQRAWATLSEAQATLGRTGFSTQVERTWRSLGADALLGPDERANTRRFFELLRRTEAGAEPLSLKLLQRGLRKLYAEPLTLPNAVELLTIHKAKGLEWDLVLLPALERGAGNSQHELLKWLELDGEDDGEPGIVLAPIQGKGQDSSALSNWLSGLQTSRQIAEAKRLFYVACTRAREELHLFAACKYTKAGELAVPRHDSLLRASWAAAQPVLALQLGPQHLDTDIPAPDLDGTRLLTTSGVQTLALAAAAERNDSPRLHIGAAPLLQRLPAHFEPLDRFRPQHGFGLPYPPASTLRHAAPFARPEGSFTARAFGNTVHRFLDLIAQQLASGVTVKDLLARLPSWQRRLQTGFRAEGLSPSSSVRETDRALHALEATLRDPIGAWLLGPHPGARSECSLQVEDGEVPQGAARNLRADRIFVAGPEPLSKDNDTHFWIVDFKTAEQGGWSDVAFFEAERKKYQPQMQAYAEANAEAGEVSRPIVLALFYPLMTHLLYWPYEPSPASN